MAMNGKVLGQEIADLITSKSAPADMQAQVKELWEKIGEAIVEHIKGADITVAAGIPLQAGSYTGATTGTGTATIK